MSSKEQLEAFEKYDFGADARWIDYYNNVTIPPGRSDGLAIVRRYKQKFYQKHVDSSFVVQPLQAAGQPSSEAASSSSARADAPSASARARSTGPSSAAGSAGAGPPPPEGSFSRTAGSAGSRGSPGADWVTFQFLANAFIIVMAVVSIFPLTPALIAYRCFGLCLMGYFATSVLGIYKRHGLPRGFSWDSIRVWLQNTSQGPEFLAIMHCGAFMPSPRPVLLAVVPVACHLAPAVAQYLQHNVSSAQIYRRYLEKPCTWLTTNNTLVNLFAANMEISLGFLVIVYMFTPQRNLILLFFYWQILKMAYHSPASAWYHRHVWTQLGAQVEPRLRQYAPFLLTPLSYAKQWFNSVPGSQ